MRSHFFQELTALLQKEFLLEWKQKYAFNGMLLYAVSMVVVISLAFVQGIPPETWIVIFWITVLFIAINAVAKSFMGDTSGQTLYLYGLASPESIIAAKMIYNALLLVFLASMTCLIYLGLNPVKIEQIDTFWGLIALGSVGLSVNMSLVAAIAARASNRMTLLSVLSFPIIVPMLLSLIRASRAAVTGNVMIDLQESIYFVGGISLVLAIISLILFPFIWRS